MQRICHIYCGCFASLSLITGDGFFSFAGRYVYDDPRLLILLPYSFCQILSLTDLSVEFKYCACFSLYTNDNVASAALESSVSFDILVAGFF